MLTPEEELIMLISFNYNPTREIKEVHSVSIVFNKNNCNKMNN